MIINEFRDFIRINRLIGLWEIWNHFRRDIQNFFVFHKLSINNQVGKAWQNYKNLTEYVEFCIFTLVNFLLNEGFQDIQILG